MHNLSVLDTGAGGTEAPSGTRGLVLPDTWANETWADSTVNVGRSGVCPGTFVFLRPSYMCTSI